MPRVTYPPGDTTASRIKSLVIWVQKTYDRAAADALIREIRVDAEYLADETRPVPVATWYRALTAFVAKYGKETLRATWTGVIDQENLGVWTRVLRGTVDPHGALGQLDTLGGEELKTTRWELVAARPGFWHGRVILSHDPMLERDGLLGLARAAELMGLPALFGYGPGTVEILPSSKVGAAAARTAALAEEYVLSWKVPSSARGALLSLGCAAVVSPILAFDHGPLGIAVVGGSLAVGGTLGVVLHSGRQRRAESSAQMNRIRALERSVALKEQRERAAVGFFEGSVIAGKYRLGRKLGAGASGVIHQATRLADNAPVAIKLLRAAVAHDTVASDRLRREAEALGLTWHPNVVEVFEHDHLPDGTAYLVMERLEGESLATRLRRVGPLPPTQVATIITQVCDALGAVHAAGVIHRDVKPSNIFLATHGDDDAPVEVKLLDFGIARVEWAETRLTNMGAPLGTPGYMSPEQEQGGDIDARSDLFGTGAVIYECFLGVPPPTTVSGSYEIVNAQASLDNLEVSAAGGAKIPAEWLTIINRAMAPLPQARYADARSMREAIESVAFPAESSVQPSAGHPAGIVSGHAPAELAAPDESGSPDLRVSASGTGTKVVTEVRKTNVSK